MMNFIRGLKMAERNIAFKARKEEIKAALIGAEKKVPKGHLAVYVGDRMRRFVIPTAYLCLPEFKEILEKMEREFGFSQKEGLRIPCEEEDFEEMISVLDEVGWRDKKGKKMMCEFGSRRRIFNKGLGEGQHVVW